MQNFNKIYFCIILINIKTFCKFRGKYDFYKRCFACIVALHSYQHRRGTSQQPKFLTTIVACFVHRPKQQHKQQRMLLWLDKPMQMSWTT